MDWSWRRERLAIGGGLLAGLLTLSTVITLRSPMSIALSLLAIAPMWAGVAVLCRIRIDRTFRQYGRPESDRRIARSILAGIGLVLLGIASLFLLARARDAGVLPPMAGAWTHEVGA